MAFKRKRLNFPIESEDSVRTAFDQYCGEVFGFKIVRSRDKYPDNRLEIVDERKVSNLNILEDKKEGEEIGAEVETLSSSFKGHDEEKCSLIICWFHDWSKCPEGLDVLQLAPYFELDNRWDMEDHKNTNINLASKKLDNQHEVLLQMRLSGLRAGIKILKKCADDRNRPRKATELWGHLSPHEEGKGDSFQKLLKGMGSNIAEEVFIDLNIERLWDLEDWNKSEVVIEDDEVKIPYGKKKNKILKRSKRDEILLQGRTEDGDYHGEATRNIKPGVLQELLSEIDLEARRKTVQSKCLGHLWNYWLNENTNSSLPSWFLS